MIRKVFQSIIRLVIEIHGKIQNNKQSYNNSQYYVQICIKIKRKRFPRLIRNNLLFLACLIIKLRIETLKNAYGTYPTMEHAWHRVGHEWHGNYGHE